MGIIRKLGGYYKWEWRSIIVASDFEFFASTCYNKGIFIILKKPKVPTKTRSQLGRDKLQKMVNGLLFLDEKERQKLSSVIRDIAEEGLPAVKKIIDAAYKKQAEWFKTMEKADSGFLFGLERKLKFLDLKTKEEKDK
jgi:hypothetical protein